MSQAKRLCLIGAGPCGMSVLYHFNKLREQGKDIPDIVCFDKQSDWGGLWNYTWETGTDQYGEPVHGSMYRGLWTNGPKEVYEFPDYTYDEHFKKPIPSFITREVFRDYLQGRWSKGDLRRWIRFNHVVRRVTYNDDTDDFSVVVKNLVEDKELPAQTFDHVVVATGHFSVPNQPFYPGIDQFPGRVLHAHDFRNAQEFKGQTIFVIGAKYSAEDIAMQTLKYGAKKIICTYRTQPMGLKWPPEITEKPLLTKIVGNTVHFKDGTSADVDSIISCTGYIHHFPFLEERLRLKTKNCLYPPGLYKGVLWTHAGNNKLLYMGMQEHFYTHTMFDAQANWAVNFITGKIKIPDKKTMEKDWMKWVARDESQPVKVPREIVAFQTDYVVDLAKEANYGYDLDVSGLFNDYICHRDENVLTYRDHSHVSKFTGTKSPLHHTVFMNVQDDPMAEYLPTK